MLQDKIKQYTEEIEQFNPQTSADVENFRLKFLVSKGIVKSLFEEFKAAPADEKRVLGKVLNDFKQLAEGKYQQAQEQFGSTGKVSQAKAEGDLTLPGDGFTLGARHPLSLVRKEIVEIFKKLGFIVAEGPEIEDDWHNFSALNFPPEHPARDMQDTFLSKNKMVMILLFVRTPLLYRCV
ncbi:putative phenylalanyl-tRNA synthetase subunit alpha [Sphingobacterium spiritivorum ATCC 33300]|uniref:Putative phenylalanyl-tRNA synthetase subunit alpha n=1 Tax=Sphingobacterium spiritivorum ATCC 33300 TaxID=525372 RepID=C2G0K7_SPHSI|nr:putative phenylalanyl-tRNA synthetase subunit alpha [Sphingobacterium spiritivorum ATCC 33300]